MKNDKNWRLTVRWRGTTVFRRTMRTVRRMRARHVDTVGSWITRLQRIAEVRLVMLETDHVRVSRVSSVRVLIVLGHQWHWHVAHRAWIRFHMRYLAHHLRHVCHLSKFQRNSSRNNDNRANLLLWEERWEDDVGRDIEDTKSVKRLWKQFRG